MVLSIDIQKIIIGYTDPKIFRYMHNFDPENYPKRELYLMIQNYSIIKANNISMEYQKIIQNLKSKITHLLEINMGYDREIKFLELQNKYLQTINKFGYKIIKILESWDLIKIIKILDIQKENLLSLEIQITEDIHNYAEMVNHSIIKNKLGYICVFKKSLKIKSNLNYDNPSIVISNNNHLWCLLKDILIPNFKDFI